MRVCQIVLGSFNLGYSRDFDNVIKSSRHFLNVSNLFFIFRIIQTFSRNAENVPETFFSICITWIILRKVHPNVYDAWDCRVNKFHEPASRNHSRYAKLLRASSFPSILRESFRFSFNSFVLSLLFVVNIISLLYTTNNSGPKKIPVPSSHIYWNEKIQRELLLITTTCINWVKFNIIIKPLFFVLFVRKISFLLSVL